MKTKKRFTKRKMFIILAVVLSFALLILGMILYGKYQMGKIPEMTFQEILEYTTKNTPNAVISVGIIKDGQFSYTVYGENGKKLPAELHTYEIGSLTKTFTASLISKAIQEGKINIDYTIDNYLFLPKGNKYPTIKELLTHTSGYKGFYFEKPMITNFFKGRNDFYGITKEMILTKTSKLNMDKENYEFFYSNYGYALLGLILESIYKTDYSTLLNNFVKNELCLTSTEISQKNGDLGKYWDWKEQDAYVPAGAITSNIEDMLSYVQIQLEDKSYFSACHKSQKVIDASTEMYKTMGIRMDEIGMAWLIDNKNGIVWHNGGTGNYNSYLGFNFETKTGVVVLSNLAPNYRIPATVLGVKLLLELKSAQF